MVHCDAVNLCILKRNVQKFVLKVIHAGMKYMPPYGPSRIISVAFQGRHVPDKLIRDAVHLVDSQK